MTEYVIEVRANDGETPINLPRVDHVDRAADAAQHLWEAIYEAAKVHGGAARIYQEGTGHVVEWNFGPKDWHQAYVVSDGADAPGFVAEAEGEFTVVFRDLD